MAKGQLALEQEKFQNEMAQQKQKKQTLDQLHQGLSQVFSQMPQTPEGTMSAMQQAIPMVGGAGEPVGPLVGQLPNLQQQVTGAATKKARSEEPRLNSSHGYISYAVFCLKKKKKNKHTRKRRSNEGTIRT